MVKKRGTIRSRKKCQRERATSFNAILLAVVIMSVMSLVASIVLGSRDGLVDYQKSIVDNCSTCWKMGFAAIITLMGVRKAGVSIR
jgi:hypothetical protein